MIGQFDSIRPLVYSALISFAPCALFSQNTSPRGRIEFSIQYQPQTNWLLNPNDYNAYKEKDYTVHYTLNNAGVSLGLYSKEFAGISVGFIYSNQGQRFINRVFVTGDLVEKYSTWTNLSYFKIPLLFSYKADPTAIVSSSKGSGKHRYFFFEFGPQLCLLKGATFSKRGQKLVLSNDLGTEISHETFFRPRNIELVVGLGGNFKISERIVFQFLFRFDYSLNDIENKMSTLNGSRFYPINRLATNTGTAGIQLGLGYKVYTVR